MRKVRVGNVFVSRSGTSYKVVEVNDHGGFVAERPGTGTTFRVSHKLLETIREEAAAGKRFRTRVNHVAGGISKTAAVTTAVVWALGLSFDPELATFGS
jgi:hypothetical protein